ncbi:RDD family protein [Campylobacter hepaticus]|uniref:RDD family protein n=1 Tax=Campylobacter hepaticus TaxID=1813019 RepID=A0A6A7JQX8_9BACT|nr:RDD family protein [Campylobacter hepaticus]AXP08281.1 RDD family protein [Campylobacter hepaticus]MDX2322703.1 RDD family protein [Campylobacter hepaticus]MDX2330750.1 RDD family protein [Campylobacter hepaticus]MDX2332135.1 RDD family protein [Campylobacter hepaticus]MDX2371365.1 RDD family protein [Campylobacter hepaticus]
MRENLQERLERENLKIASFTKRVLAFLIDDMIISLIIFIIFYDRLMQAKDILETTQIIGNFYLGLILLHFSYQTIFTYLYGASLGKIVCKIIILDENLLDKPNLIQSCIRSAIRQVSAMVFMLGFAWALSNNLRKSWEDYLARTIVVDVG